MSINLFLDKYYYNFITKLISSTRIISCKTCGKSYETLCDLKRHSLFSTNEIQYTTVSRQIFKQKL